MGYIVKVEVPLNHFLELIYKDNILSCVKEVTLLKMDIVVVSIDD
jgi:hypothetical protein